jgi:hypothetical protein
MIIAKGASIANSAGYASGKTLDDGIVSAVRTGKPLEISSQTGVGV